MLDNNSLESPQADTSAPVEAPLEAPDVMMQDVTPRVVSNEIRDFDRAQQRRRHLVPRAALVGLLTGLVAVAFRGALDEGEAVRLHLIELAGAHAAWAGVIFPILLGAIGAGSGVFLVQQFCPEASGSGIPHLKVVLHRMGTMRWVRVLMIKFAGGVFSIGGGLALGREGPTVQMGGAIGQAISKALKSSPRERQTLIAAGAGAGLAAAFNAPLSGLMFVLEEVQRDFTPGVFTAAFVACVSADVVMRGLLGQLPAFRVPAFPTPPLDSLPLFLLLGALTGLLGVLFNRALLSSLRAFERAANWPRGAKGAFAGAIVGLIGWFAPQALGGGHQMVESTLAGHVVLQVLPLLFLLRFALTMLSYGSGAPGGIFAPLLVLGAQIGLAVGLIGQHFFPQAVPEPAAFAVVGMAAYFTAIVRAPLTGIVLIVEMTGNYALMLPLLLACLTAYALADLLGDLPVYEALLERDLLRGRESQAETSAVAPTRPIS